MHSMARTECRRVQRVIEPGSKAEVEGLLFLDAVVLNLL